MLEQIFSVCSALAIVGWILLVTLPRHRIAHLVASVAIPLAIALVYIVLIAQHFGSADGGFGSLADVSRLFANPALLLAGWVHYLAFDLFIGAWEVRDASATAWRTPRHPLPGIDVHVRAHRPARLPGGAHVARRHGGPHRLVADARLSSIHCSRAIGSSPALPSPSPPASSSPPSPRSSTPG